MSDDAKLVWVDGVGDTRKQKNTKSSGPVDESLIHLEVRRLTSGKGRTIIEIKGLPSDKKWCKNLAKDLKRKLGVGGAYKNDFIEIHGEKLELVTQVLDQKNLKWKQTGG
jgi:translation initiation factor 1